MLIDVARVPQPLSATIVPLPQASPSTRQTAPPRVRNATPNPRSHIRMPDFMRRSPKVLAAQPRTDPQAPLTPAPVRIRVAVIVTMPFSQKRLPVASDSGEGITKGKERISCDKDGDVDSAEEPLDYMLGLTEVSSNFPFDPT